MISVAHHYANGIPDESAAVNPLRNRMAMPNTILTMRKLAFSFSWDGVDAPFLRPILYGKYVLNRDLTE